MENITKSKTMPNPQSRKTYVPKDEHSVGKHAGIEIAPPRTLRKLRQHRGPILGGTQTHPALNLALSHVQLFDEADELGGR